MRVPHCMHSGDHPPETMADAFQMVSHRQYCGGPIPLDVCWLLTLPPMLVGTSTFWGSATKKDARIRTLRSYQKANQHVPRFLAVFVNFLTVHPSTNRSPQSTPLSLSPQVLVMFPLTASSSKSSQRSASTQIRTFYPFWSLIASAHVGTDFPPARETRSYLAFRVLRDALSK